MAELMQADLAKVGVTAEIVSYEWGEYLKRAADPKHDGAVLLGWTGDNGDTDNFLATLLSCDGVGTSSNAAAFCNEEYEKVVQEAKRVSSQEERAKLYKQAQEIFKQQAPGRRSRIRWSTFDAQERHRFRAEPARRLHVRRRRHHRVIQTIIAGKGAAPGAVPLSFGRSCCLT